jgi:hypothetical protein
VIASSNCCCGRTSTAAFYGASPRQFRGEPLRICGEAAAWCFQQQDEDTIEMCRLCSRLFERDYRTLTPLRICEAMGKPRHPQMQLHRCNKLSRQCSTRSEKLPLPLCGRIRRNPSECGFEGCARSFLTSRLEAKASRSQRELKPRERTTLAQFIWLSEHQLRTPVLVNLDTVRATRHHDHAAPVEILFVNSDLPPLLVDAPITEIHQRLKAPTALLAEPSRVLADELK